MSGPHDVIAATDLTARCPALLARVARRVPLVVTRHGRPVARRCTVRRLPDEPG
jgi:antitoxin (DNA-binding transcriptional repressor) of toxin-antitoxin stability system